MKLVSVVVGITAWVRTVTARPRWRPVARWRPIVGRIRSVQQELSRRTDDELRRESLALRYRARSGEPLDRLLPEAFGLVSEAASRRLGMRHFDVQLLGGTALHHGCVAEMETGEGKTLTATLPLYLNALAGAGAHLATANDYLARRDAEWTRPLYEALGLSVGVVESRTPRPARHAAYACDITYGTAKEFGFDFLRDRLLLRQIRDGQIDPLTDMTAGAGGADPNRPIQRRLHFVLFDEADSLLIDEARTPLILSAIPPEQARVEAACFAWGAENAGRFVEDEHYTYDPYERRVELTASGRQFVRGLPKPPLMDRIPQWRIYEHAEQAVKVARDFHRDRQYVVRDGEIVIVDENTGRLAEGRKWRDGVHQAVEAKEGLAVSAASGHAARVTVQEFARKYERCAGMTGTAASAAREFRRVYKTPVVRIPTHRPSRRVPLPGRVLPNADEKWRAIAAEVRELHAAGRPVLVGTRSIDRSEELSRLLTESGIEHQVLHARRLAAEAEIVAQAGQRGRVTVATNMAGRGTDIKLGEGVAEAGGLHVICSELHDSARIDRQLIGRCGRQGDPGSCRFFMALDDELLVTAFGPARASELQSRYRTLTSLDHLYRVFHRAQRIVERKQFRERKLLMRYVERRAELQTRMGQDPHLDTPE